ncbi:hypothetical protein HY493_00200 [Candidatus Woesearchaeota archaeon]|nr:hypothetical protein [Candidatus Woesearchaeota archaeon]
MNKFHARFGLLLLIGILSSVPVLGQTTCPTSGNVTINDSCTLAAGTFTYDILVINASATVTAQGDTGASGFPGVEIIANTMTINGTLTANGQGFGASTGPGQGIDTAESGSAGAGGAGYGGAGAQSASGTPAGIAYGNTTAPASLGSGGGTGGGSGVGGAGGGAILLNVSGTLTILGTVTANGSAGGNTGSDNGGGGGSGGSIFIQASTLAGNGLIMTNGGTGGTGAAAGNGGGGGGGGRIAMIYTTSTFTGTTRSFGNIGAGLATAYQAEDGSVAVNNKGGISCAQGSPDKTCTITGTHLLPNENMTFANVTIGNTSADSASLSINNSYRISINASRFEQRSGGHLSVGTNVIISIASYSLSSLILSGNTSLGSGTILNLTDDALIVNGTVQGAVSVPTVINVRRATAGNGTFTLSGTMAAQNITVIMTNMTIAALANLSTTGRGLTSANGPGRGINTSESGSGGAGGAGFGGTGAQSGSGTFGGLSYGSATAPAVLGSGGGSGGGSGLGGTGGGFIHMNLSSVLTVNGLIVSNGSTGGSDGSGNGGGGGSGGSIFIQASTLAGNGLIMANGGTGGTGLAAGNGGGGAGGGRISITYTTSNFTGTMQSLGNIGAGLATAYQAEDGTIAVNNAIGSLCTTGSPDKECVVIGNHYAPNLALAFTNLTFGNATVQGNITLNASYSVTLNATRLMFRNTSLAAVGARLHIIYSASFEDAGSVYGSASRITLENRSVARVAWTSFTAVVGNLSRNVRLGTQLVSVNASSQAGLNTSANITFIGLTTTANMPLIDFEDDGTFVDCPASVCTKLSDVGGTLVFNVSHFTGFSSSGNSTTNLTIYDETDSTTQYPGDTIEFFGDYYNGTSGFDILGASCNASFGVDSTAQSMTYSAINGAYKTTKTYGGSGTTDWNVTCAAAGFDTLTANDTVTITAIGVPEFSTWTLLIALAGVMMGFFVIRSRNGV